MDWKKKLKFIAIVTAFAILILIIFSNIFKMTQVTEKDFKTYKQGLFFLNQNDLENAYYNFSNISKNSALYSISLLRQGMCADELNDTDTAIKKLRLYIEKYPDSIFTQKAHYTLAQNYFRAKDFTKAEKTFNIIRKDYKDSDYSTASDYYLGLMLKEKIQNDKKNNEQLKQKAKEHFLEYLKNAPNGRFSQNCLENIEKLGINLSQQEYFIIAKAYYVNENTKQALINFEKSHIKDCWNYIVLVKKKQGHYQKARELFELNYPIYSPNIEENELLTTIENYVSINPYGEKYGWEKALSLSEQTNAKGRDYILYKLTKFKNGEEKKALYEKIYIEFPEGKYSSDALANLFWDAYTKKEYQKAFKYGTKHIREYQNTIASPQIVFWMGKLSQKLGHKNEALGFYQRVLDNYPDSYYAYRAAKHLGLTKTTNWKTKPSHKLNEKQFVPKFPVKYTTISDDNISLINEILKLNDYKLLGEIDKNNKAVMSWIKYKEENFSISALFARDAIAEMEEKPDFSDEIYKLAYPLHFQETINNIATKYKLDPYIISSLIREESYFNPKTESSAGAIGLMQLMPTTAQFIANKNNIPYQNKEELYVPQKNIELGSAYLNYTKEKLYENDLLAVASYNGGPGAVQVWKDKLNYQNFDEFIENIPYPETKEYVKKVFRSYWVYLNIY